MHQKCCFVITFHIGISAIFRNFWSNFFLIHSSCWFYGHFFALNHGIQICFLCETQKYVEMLNKTWIIIFYIGILAIFCNFWAHFWLVHSRCWFYDHLFAKNHGIKIYFLCETQKYVEILNNTWIITFYIGILAIFSNFGGNFCLVHSSHWLSGYMFAWNHGRQIFSVRITQKIVPVLKYDENFCRKLTKIAKFEVNLGYRGKFRTNWVLNK